MAAEPELAEVDPLDLPAWLSGGSVAWRCAGPLRDSPRVEGHLEVGEQRLGFDLLAVDEAYPRPSCPEPQRRSAHQAWTLGQVLLLESPRGRVTAAVPGTRFDADTVLEAFRRVAKAVALPADAFVVCLSL